METDRKKITEENLIRCGREEFLEKGYAGANLRNICKRAGVTTGAFSAPWMISGMGILYGRK
jgi:AcrR family transcriptional regulator